MIALKDHRVWDILESNGLLTDEQFQKARADCNQFPDATTIAEQLVSDGWLTPWQARQLLLGGRQLRLGPYVLVDVVGRGGTSTVFKARDTRSGQTVALKVLSPGYRNKPGAVAMFLREGRIAATLKHPHLISTFGIETVDGTYALVSEHAEGWSLRTWITAFRQLPIGWSCDWAWQAARGLQFLIEAGVVHRDIKPGNLLVALGEFHAPTIKILDLGISRLMSETEDGGRLNRESSIGTPDYVAPEQVDSRGEVDIRADIYSLGCTLFELLTGRVPFGGRTVVEKIMARMVNDPPSVQQYRPEVCDELAGIVARMLARNPCQRFQTPAEVAAALARFCEPLTASQVDGLLPPTTKPIEEQITSIVLFEDSRAFVWTKPTEIHSFAER